MQAHISRYVVNTGDLPKPRKPIYQLHCSVIIVLRLLCAWKPRWATPCVAIVSVRLEGCHAHFGFNHHAPSSIATLSTMPTWTYAHRPADLIDRSTAQITSSRPWNPHQSTAHELPATTYRRNRCLPPNAGPDIVGEFVSVDGCIR